MDLLPSHCLEQARPDPELKYAGKEKREFLAQCNFCPLCQNQTQILARQISEPQLAFYLFDCKLVTEIGILYGENPIRPILALIHGM